MQSVEECSPAFDAGLRVNDLVTHINNESIQGLQHVEVVRLILQGGETIKLAVTELDKTSIRTGRKRKSIGNRVLTRPRSQSRNRINVNDDSNRSTSSKKSPLFRRLRPKAPSLRRNSSVKRTNKKAALRMNSQNCENDSVTSSTPTSISPNSMITSRPGTY